MGKKLSDSTSDETSFAKKDLPQNHRVVDADGGMMTMDHNPDRYDMPGRTQYIFSVANPSPSPYSVLFAGKLILTLDADRLNVHVDKDGTVRKVTHG